jgi:P27 family predicted phage terminase small subunit
VDRRGERRRGVGLIMAPGRVKTPAALRLLTGRTPTTDSGGRPVETPPPFKRGGVEVPPEVAADPRALELWRRVLPELERLDIVKPEDAGAFANYCLTTAALFRAHAEHREAGWPMVGQTSQGASVHPLVRVIAELSGRQIRAAEQFGLTPAAESKLGDWSTRGQASGPTAAAGDSPFAGTG